MSNQQKFMELLKRIHDKHMSMIFLLIDSNKDLITSDEKKIATLRTYFNNVLKHLDFVLISTMKHESSGASYSGASSSGASSSASSIYTGDYNPTVRLHTNIQNQETKNKAFLEKYPTVEAFNSDPNHPLYSDRYYNLWAKSKSNRNSESKRSRTERNNKGKITSFFGPKVNSRRTTQKNNR